MSDRNLFVAVALVGCVLAWMIYSSRPATEQPLLPQGPSIPSPAIAKRILLFTLKSCAPCQEQKQVFLNMRVQRFISEMGYKVYYVEGPDPIYFSRNQVKSVPTVIAQVQITDTYREVSRFTGFKNTEELLAWLTTLPNVSGVIDSPSPSPSATE